MDKRLIDADKIMEWINFEIAKQLPDGVEEYADGRRSVMEFLARRIEQGVFIPYPSPSPTIKAGDKVIKDQSTSGTCDKDEIGEIVQDMLDANSHYNKVYISNIYEDEWEIVGRLEVSHD